MIDLHSHVLPNVDDGANTLEETLGILRQLENAGFTQVLATPHVIEGRSFLEPNQILALTERVRKQAVEEGLTLEIHPGSENFIFPDMAQWARDGRLLTLGNRGQYLLIELPMLEIPSYTEHVFFELLIQGITPVLAHPERHPVLYRAPETLLDWARKGVLFQQDLRSIRGKYGVQAKRLAELMLMHDLVHFLGSDAHRLSQSKNSYRDALQAVKTLIGEEKFLNITQINPQYIIEGQILPAPKVGTRYEAISVKTEKKRWLQWIFRR